MVMFEKLGLFVIDDGGVNFVVGVIVGGGMVINWFVCFEMFFYVL